MRVSYRCNFDAKCPMNAKVVDHYTLLIEADGMIKAEDLRAVLSGYAGKAMFQEEITQDIATRFAPIGKVTTTGFHSGVETVCVVEV